MRGFFRNVALTGSLLFFMISSDLSARKIGAVSVRENQAAVNAVLDESTPQFNRDVAIRTGRIYCRRCRRNTERSARGSCTRCFRSGTVIRSCRDKSTTQSRSRCRTKKSSFSRDRFQLKSCSW